MKAAASLVSIRGLSPPENPSYSLGFLPRCFTVACRNPSSGRLYSPSMKAIWRLAVQPQSSASSSCASQSKESSWFSLNRRREAVPFCLWPQFVDELPLIPTTTGHSKLSTSLLVSSCFPGAFYSSLAWSVACHRGLPSCIAAGRLIGAHSGDRFLGAPLPSHSRITSESF
jgi:hypothetical protein